MLASYLRQEIVKAIRQMDRQDPTTMQRDLEVLQRLARCYWGAGARERAEAAYDAELKAHRIPISVIEQFSGVFFYVL